MKRDISRTWIHVFHSTVCWQHVACFSLLKWHSFSRGLASGLRGINWVGSSITNTHNMRHPCGQPIFILHLHSLLITFQSLVVIITCINTKHQPHHPQLSTLNNIIIDIHLIEYLFSIIVIFSSQSIFILFPNYFLSPSNPFRFNSFLNHLRESNL